MDAGCLGLLKGQGVTGGDGPVVENNSLETIREQNTSLMHATHITAFLLQIILSQAEQRTLKINLYLVWVFLGLSC